MIHSATRLRHHIHRELMEIHGLDNDPEDPTKDPIKELRIQKVRTDLKKSTMRHSIRIMKEHGRSDAEISEMLKERFFVSADEAERIMKESDTKAEQKESEREEAEKNKPLKTASADG